MMDHLMNKRNSADARLLCTNKGAEESSKAIQCETIGKQSDAVSNNVPIDTSKSYTGRRRKQSRPTRSPPAYDPNFRGAIVSFHVGLQWNQLPCYTLSRQFCFRPPKSVRPRNTRYHFRPRRTSIGDSSKSDNSDLDDDNKKDYLDYIGCFSDTCKQCASCATKKTPLWRDAEDGTPLCNACGIRYKKYRIRCGGCWRIPRKDAKTSSRCFKCGGCLRYSTFPRFSYGY